MKPVVFRGKALAAIRTFPVAARREAGYQIDRLQQGLDPVDWKPMPGVGRGVREIRIRQQGQFRVIYVSSLPREVVILHAFRKKTDKTLKADLARARAALKDVQGDLST